MSSTRKLQGEIDRLLKKVQEGMVEFDGILSKVQSASSANQREKYESDLKKEIKKLQRSRDQIKAWISSSEVKQQKSILLEARKSIESKMEQFKATERESKNKSFPKEGPINAQESEAKIEMRNFLQKMIRELERQIEKFESDVEAVPQKKRKDNSKIEELQNAIDKHKHHLLRLERLLRHLDNDNVQPEQVAAIKDNVEYYVESNQDPDFYEDETMYDDFGGLLDEDDEKSKHSDEEDEDDDVSSQNSDESFTSKSSSNSAPAPAPTLTPTPITAPTPAPPAPVVAPVIPTPQPKSVPTPAPAPAPVKQTVVQPAKLTASGELPVVVPKKSTQPINYSALLSASAKQTTTTTPATPNPPPQTSTPTPTVTPTPTPVSTPLPTNLGNSGGTVTLPKPPTATPVIPPQPTIVSPPVNPVSALASSHAEPLQQPKSLKEVASNVYMRTQQTPSEERKEVADMVQPEIKSVDKEPVSVLSMLETSFLNIPLASDSERPKQYTPRNPAPTPSYYPQSPAPVFETPSAFDRFDLDTLFFIFYYNQGTYQQYLAAKELKKQSWRYHKKYLTWFQRHEHPKERADEYELGTYVYFDYESVWSQRKKSEFMFEYRYLEDCDL